MRSVLVMGDDSLQRWEADYLRGLHPGRLPYNLEHLRTLGYDMRSVSDMTLPRPVQKAADVIDHRSGYPVSRAIEAVPLAASGPDFLLSLLEHNAVPALWAASRRLWPYRGLPHVLFGCWIAEQFQVADERTRQRLLNWYKQCAMITFFSDNQAEILLNAGLPDHALQRITWGVDHEYFTPGDGERDIDVLAVGQDRGRDYRTLFDAAGSMTLEIKVVCKPENLAGLSAPPNVRIHGTVPHAAYRSLLRRARIVAIPTYELAYPTGSSVALEAAACGACVVATDTPAMRSYLTDQVNARLVAPGDTEGWHVLETLLSDEPQRARLADEGTALVHRQFNAKSMWSDVHRGLLRRGLGAQEDKASPMLDPNS